jgi:hypothetical protein
MKDSFNKTIYKFAILLSVEYLINLIWVYYFHSFVSRHAFELQNPYIDFVSFIPRAITIIFNIVYMILVYLELKSNNIKNILIVLITLFFGFIGIALFFLLIIYDLYIKKTNTQHQLKHHADYQKD